MQKITTLLFTNSPLITVAHNTTSTVRHHVFLHPPLNTPLNHHNNPLPLWYALQITVKLNLQLNIILLASSEQPSASCYICSGLNCAPHVDQLSSCKSPVSADKVRCFFVAIDQDNIYRGCYEKNGTHVDFCREHRLNYCRICRGQGCNNKPIYSDTPFSCRKCLTIGPCHYTDAPEKITFHSCPPFFYGHVPRCFSYYYYGRLRYFFSCANEVPLQIRSSCSVDTFYSVCRYCDQPNCNDNDYFANFQMIPHYRNVCLRRDVYINCNLYTSLVPIMGCFWDEANLQDQGCLNTIDYKMYGDVVREEYIQLCYDQQRCNQKNRGGFN